MIKILLALSFILGSITSLHAEEALIVCPVLHYSKVKKIVEGRGSYDKYKHCAVSCLLTLRCPAKDVLDLGILKEGIDMVGPGNAEIEDLKADIVGIKFVTKKKAKTDNQCINLCLNHYSNSCN